MQKNYYIGNRIRLYEKLKESSVLLLFSGRELRKTNDEFYPFYTDRNFLYLTGLESKDFILLAKKDAGGKTEEYLYILPPDPMVERWNGSRIKAGEAAEISGIEEIRYLKSFQGDFHRIASSGNYRKLYLDFAKLEPSDIDRPAELFFNHEAKDYPYLDIENFNPLIRSLRTIKQPCEITALRQAEQMTRAGILAMMKASKPGMYEYQYKAEFDHAIGQYGPNGIGFPSIISAGKNNFCIHYYEYTGKAVDGDMILNDVGAMSNHLITDVSRGWPCNGRFSEKQKLLYTCALNTSDYMFKQIKPGMKMREIDEMIKVYNSEQLLEAGVLRNREEVDTYMWHGGAHHIGYDVHDAIITPEVITPNMVFCVDVGIYHEEWGIGFRLEDNCLITEAGCENLSQDIPRTIEEIEENMSVGR